MPAKQPVNWETWVRAFWHGRLPVIYLMLVQVAYSIFLLIYVHLTVFFYPAVVAVIATYGVFTDEVAHLFPLAQNGEITFKEWMYKMLHGRTHDVYGMLIAMVSASVILMGFLYWVGISIVVFDVMCFFQIGAFAVTRFYH